MNHREYQVRIFYFLPFKFILVRLVFYQKLVVLHPPAYKVKVTYLSLNLMNNLMAALYFLENFQQSEENFVLANV